MDGVQQPQGDSHFEEAVYFLPFSPQKFLVLNSWYSKFQSCVEITTHQVTTSYHTPFNFMNYDPVLISKLLASTQRCIFKTSIYDGMYFWGNILQLKSGNYFCKRIFNWDVSHGPDYATATPTQPSMKIITLDINVFTMNWYFCNILRWVSEIIFPINIYV